MNKLINEVKKEIANRAVELEKAKIKQMLSLIDDKEQYLKVIKEEITTLKEQLEKGDYRVLKQTWGITTYSTPHILHRLNRIGWL